MGDHPANPQTTSSGPNVRTSRPDQTKPVLSRTNAVTLGCCPRRHRRAAHPCVPARCPGRAIADPPFGSPAGWMLAMNPAPAKTPRMTSLVNTATATPRTTPIPTMTVISNQWLVRSVLVIVVLPPAIARALPAISRWYARLLRLRWDRVWLLRQGVSFLSCTITLADWGHRADRPRPVGPKGPDVKGQRAFP